MLCFKQKTAYDMRISDWSSDVCSSDLWTPTRSAAGPYSPWLIVSIISLPTFMEVLDTSIANVSLGHIAGGLSITSDQAKWVLTSYLVANAVVIPISGWLSDAIGRTRYFMISIALFTISLLLFGRSEERRVGEERVRTG